MKYTKLIAVLFLLSCNNLVHAKTNKRLKERFKHYLSEKYEAFKEKIIYEVLVPMYIKYEEIKEEGPTTKDYIVGGTTLAGVSGLTAYCKSDFIKKNKWPLIAGAISIGALAISYKAYKSIVSAEDTPDYKINQFIQSLSKSQQCLIFDNPNILSLLADAAQNPELLIDNEEFMAILSEEEQVELQSIIQLNYSC